MATFSVTAEACVTSARTSGVETVARRVGMTTASRQRAEIGAEIGACTWHSSKMTACLVIRTRYLSVNGNISLAGSIVCYLLL